MNNLQIVDHFIASIERKSKPDFTIDNEKFEKEISKDSQTYSGLGIKILSVCGGLLGSLLFLGFVTLSISESPTATFIFGLIVLGGAVLLDKISNSTVLDAVCIGAFLSGCTLLGYSINQMTDSANLTIFSLLVIAVATVASTENYMLNLFGLLMFNSCLFAFIETNNVNILIHFLTAFLCIGFVIINLVEHKALVRSISVNKRYPPFRIGFLVSLSVLLIYFAIYFAKPSFPYRWVSSLIIMAATIYNISSIIDFLKLKTGQFIIYIFAITILASVIFAPSICGAILILIVGIHVGHRLTIVFGIVALFYFVGQFYYDLQYTLLTKSIIMICTGALLLVVAYIFNRQIRSYDKD
ncbi:DUF4401 domain-containing protein [Pedobacter sp. HDW13]|uniref:DUF4401 domain-containing protein n=1 Tax=Pedobacter sp. HDW13 TaxID=2714940 RepID=UPI001409CC52|nr:DUF4401 domain-containing protein [Pedobacter sp. HDW13]QIL38368.1 DUF4401 domain-containing protein [Pedobacter sp. HDW13]